MNWVLIVMHLMMWQAEAFTGTVDQCKIIQKTLYGNSETMSMCIPVIAQPVFYSEGEPSAPSINQTYILPE